MKIFLINPSQKLIKSKTFNIISSKTQSKPNLIKMSESLISRKELQQMYKKGTIFDLAAEDLLLKLGEDFFVRVMDLACKSATLRESSLLEIEDIKIILEKYWSIKLPEFEKEDSSKQTRRSAAKSKREGNVRKILNTRGK